MGYNIFKKIKIGVKRKRINEEIAEQTVVNQTAGAKINNTELCRSFSGVNNARRRLLFAIALPKSLSILSRAVGNIVQHTFPADENQCGTFYTTK